MRRSWSIRAWYALLALCLAILAAATVTLLAGGRMHALQARGTASVHPEPAPGEPAVPRPVLAPVTARQATTSAARTTPVPLSPGFTSLPPPAMASSASTPVTVSTPATASPPASVITETTTATATETATATATETATATVTVTPDPSPDPSPSRSHEPPGPAPGGSPP